jgi:hypothetical protein
VLDARLMYVLCKKIIVAKSIDVKTGSNVAESSREGHGSSMAVLTMMTMNALERSMSINISYMYRNTLAFYIVLFAQIYYEVKYKI